MATSRTELKVGENLEPNQPIFSPQGKYNLCLQGNGELWLLEGDRVAWKSHSGSIWKYKMFITNGGNLVIWDLQWNKEVWSAKTEGKGDARSVLKVEDSGEFHLSSEGKIFWTSKTKPSDRIEAPGSLGIEQILLSPSGNCRFYLDKRYRLKIFENGKQTWDADTMIADRIILSQDGNFKCVRGDADSSYWETATTLPNRTGKVALILMDDGVLVLKNDNKTLWSTNGDKYPVEGANPNDFNKQVTNGVSRLTPGEFLSPGQFLVSPNKQYTALFQKNGSWTLTREPIKQVLWTSPEYPDANKLCMTYNNNMLLFDSKGRVIWSTETQKVRECSFTLDDDGNMFVQGYTGNTSWASWTSRTWQAPKWTNQVWLPASKGSIDSLLPGQSLAVDQILQRGAPYPRGKEMDQFGFTDMAVLWAKNERGTTYYYTENEEKGAVRLTFDMEGIFITNSAGKKLWSIKYSEPYGKNYRERDDDANAPKLLIDKYGDVCIKYDSRILWNLESLPHGPDAVRPKA